MGKLKEKKILIYDDDRGVAEVTKEVLQLTGAEVVLMNEIIDICEDVVNLNPDIILLDLWVPSNGKEVVKELKEDGRTKTIPVLLFSTQPELSDASFKAGADGFISKPYDIYELQRTIEVRLLS